MTDDDAALKVDHGERPALEGDVCAAVVGLDDPLLRDASMVDLEMLF